MAHLGCSPSAIFSIMGVSFQDGGQMVNFGTKVSRTSIEDLHVRFTETQTWCKSDQWKLTCRRFYARNDKKTCKFQDGGQTVNFGTKVSRTSIEELHVRFTETQTWCQSEQRRPRYWRFYVTHDKKPCKISYFSKWRPNGYF